MPTESQSRGVRSTRLASAARALAALLALALPPATGPALAGPPLLMLDQSVPDDTWRLPPTPLHGAAPHALQRGVLIDGTARRGTAWGWAIHAQPFEHADPPARDLAGVDLFTGAFSRSELDLHLPSAGTGWPIGRSYATAPATGPAAAGAGPAPSDLSPQGRGWFQSARPELVFDPRAQGSADDRALIVYAADAFLEFRFDTLVDGRPVYRGVNGTAGTLLRSAGPGDTWSNGAEVWRYVDLDGTYTEFLGAGWGNAAGQMWRTVATDGAIAAVGHATDPLAAASAGFAPGSGRAVLMLERAPSGEVFRRATLSYSAPIGGAPRLERVVIEHLPDGQSSWQSLAEVRYHYYGATSPQCGDSGGGDPLAGLGLPGDLREVVTAVLLRAAVPATQTDPATPAAWVTTRTHYRYDVRPAAGSWPATSRLAGVWGPEAVRAIHFQTMLAPAAAWENSDTLSAINCLASPPAGVGGVGGVGGLVGVGGAAETEVRYGPAGSAEDGRVVAVRAGSSCACSAGEHLIGYVALGTGAGAGYQPTARLAAVVQRPADNLVPLPPLPPSAPAPPPAPGAFEFTSFDRCGQPLAHQVSTGDPRGPTPGTTWVWGVERDSAGLVARELNPSSATLNPAGGVQPTGLGVWREFDRDNAAGSTTAGYVLAERQSWAGSAGGAATAKLSAVEYSVRTATHLGAPIPRPWVSAAIVFGIDPLAGERTDIARQWHADWSGADGAGWSALTPAIESVDLPAASTSRLGSGVRGRLQRALDAGGRVIAQRTAMGRVSTAAFDPRSGLMLGSTEDSTASIDGFDPGGSLDGTPTPRTTLITSDALGRTVGLTHPDGRSPRVERFRLPDHRVVTMSSPAALAAQGQQPAGHHLPLSYSVADHAGNETARAVVGIATPAGDEPVLRVTGPSAAWLDEAATQSAESPVFGGGSGGALQAQELQTWVRVIGGSRLLEHRAWNGPPGPEASARVTSWTHDPAGRPARTRAPDGTTIETQVDALGRTVLVMQGLAEPSPITALPAAVATVASLHYDEQLSVRGSNEATRLRLDSGQPGAGGILQQLRRFDTRGRLLAEENPGPPHTVWTRDNLGRPLSSAHYDGQPGNLAAAIAAGTSHQGGRLSLWTAQYDELGRLVRSRQVRPDAPFNGDPMSLPDDLFLERRTFFDDHGRPRLTLGDRIELLRYNRHDELIKHDLLAGAPAGLTHPQALALNLDSPGAIGLESCSLLREEPSGLVKASVSFAMFPAHHSGSTWLLKEWTAPPIVNGGVTIELPTQSFGLPDIWFYDYDALQRPRRRAHAGNAGRSEGWLGANPPPTPISWHDALSIVPNPRFRRTDITRDGFDRITAQSSPDGNNASTFDFAGRPVDMAWFPRRAPGLAIPGSNNPQCPDTFQAQLTEWDFDDLTGRLIKTRSSFADSGADPSGARSVRLGYANDDDACDGQGRAIHGGLPVGMIYTDSNCQSTLPAHLPAATRFDWLGRPGWASGIDGMLMAVHERDPMGRPTRLLRWRGDAAAPPPAGAGLQLDLLYDPAGRPTLIHQQPLGPLGPNPDLPGQYHALHRFQYDAWGNLVGSWTNPDPTGQLLPPGLAPSFVPQTVPRTPPIGFQDGVGAPPDAPFGLLRDWRLLTPSINPPGAGTIDGWRRLVPGGLQTPGNMTSDPSRPWLSHPWQGVLPDNQFVNHHSPHDLPTPPGMLRIPDFDIDKLTGRVGGLSGGSLLHTNTNNWNQLNRLSAHRYTGDSGLGWDVVAPPGIDLGMYMPFRPALPRRETTDPSQGDEIRWLLQIAPNNVPTSQPGQPTTGLDLFGAPEAVSVGRLGMAYFPDRFEHAVLYQAAAYDHAGTPVGMIYKGPATDLSQLDRDCHNRLRDLLVSRVTAFPPPGSVLPSNQSGLSTEPRLREGFRLDPLGNPKRFFFFDQPCAEPSLDNPDAPGAVGADGVGIFDPHTGQQIGGWYLDPTQPPLPCNQPPDETVQGWPDGPIPPWWPPVSADFDNRGNRLNPITPDGRRLLLTYDLDNRLTSGAFAAPAPGTGLTAPPPVVRFGYDALGRKAWKQVTLPATPGSPQVAFREFYTYDELWRLISVHRQERPLAPDGLPTASSVWADLRLHEFYIWNTRGLDGITDSGAGGGGGGGATDKLLVRLRDADGDPCNGLEEAVFPLHNLRGDVVALLDAAGRTLEWIDYTANGLPRAIPARTADIARSDGEPGPDGSVDNGDFALFFNAFFATEPRLHRWADIARTDATGGPDGSVDNGDFQAFFEDYFNNATPEYWQTNTPRWGTLSSTGWAASTRSVPTSSGDGDPCASTTPRTTAPFTRDLGLNWRLGHAGYEYDPHLGLYHVRHRTLDPRDGRWLQRDPIGYPGGWNLYQYAGGDPFRLALPPPLGCGPIDLTSDLDRFASSGSPYASCSINGGGGGGGGSPQAVTITATNGVTPPGVGRPNGLKSKDPLEQFLNNIEANGGYTAGGNLQSDTSKKLIGEIREAQAFVGGFVEGVKDNAHLGKLAVHAATHLSGPVGWVAKSISLTWGLLDGEPILPGLPKGLTPTREIGGKAIVYERSYPGAKPYIGKAKSPERFEARQREHDRNLERKHEYSILGRASSDTRARALEELLIRLRGGPECKKGPLANKRYAMNERDFRRYYPNGPSKPVP